ncbi:MAG: hypothetical protein HQL78_07775 [Magnetococcales bacterium]|nr:hypothetical protein [Magnetococcales bacterium]
MTAQEPEIITIRRKKNPMRYLMYSEPLEELWEQQGNRPDLQSMRTSNWRGYVGHWSIRKRKLFLLNVEVCSDTYDWDSGLGEKEAMILETLPGPLDGGLFASWFSGRLDCPYGECLEYRHMGYKSIYERFLILKIENGIVIGEEDMSGDEHCVMRRNEEPFF